MVKFLAEKAVDMRDLWELGKLRDWDNVQAPNINIGANFSAPLKSNKKIKYKFVGEELTTIADHPVSGILKKVVISYEKEKYYQVSKLSIIFFETEVQKPFKGDFERSLFKKNDFIKGSDEDDVLIGYRGNDRINGRAGDDNIAGKKGRDKLKGADGNDKLTGGPGGDKFIFNAALSATGNVDKITDFVVGEDKIKLSNDVFAGIGGKGRLASEKFTTGSAAKDGDDRIVYDKTSGALSYDGDGSGGDAATVFARLDAGLKLSASDFAVFS